MRNLKKVLSLTLALVMMLGMMTFAGAAETKKVTAADFKDMDKVVNKEAVTLLVDLGIINGIKAADGTYTFNPAGNIERGAYSKMIYAVMMNRDNADVYKGANTGLKDVKGHWAEGFIGYCVSTKIAVGNGNGTFTPNANISVVAGAKMLLTALGYDAKLSKYESDPLWSINIMADAQNAGLLEGVLQNADEILTRDNAAQMIYNALFADQKKAVLDRDMGVAYLKEYVNKYGDGKNLLGQSVFGLKEVTAQVLGTKNMPFASTGTLKDGQVQVAIANFNANGDVVDYAGDKRILDIKVTSALLGHEVKYFTDSKDKVLSTTLVETGKTKVYETSEKYAKFVTDNNLTGITGSILSASYDAVEAYSQPGSGVALFIDTNGAADKDIEFVVNTTYTFSNVTDVNATKGTIRIAGLPVMELKNVSGAEGLVKGDFINYSRTGTAYTVEKAPSVVGTVTSVKSSKTNATIGTTAYDITADEDDADLAIVATAQAAKAYITSLAPKDAKEGTFYLNKAGEVVVYVGDPTTAVEQKYAIVTGVKVTPDEWTGKSAVELKLILADGTQTTVKTIDEANKAGDTDAIKSRNFTNSLYDLAVFYKTSAPTKLNTNLADKVYAYTVDKDGNYKFPIPAGQVGTVTLKDDKTAVASIADLSEPTSPVHGCTTEVTGNEHTAGKAEVVAAAAFANDKTVVIFKDATDANNIKYTSYTGVAKIPGWGESTIGYVDVADTLYTPFIFVTGKAIGEATAANYAYGITADYAVTATGWAYDMIVNGEKVTLTLAADATVTPAANKIYSYTITDGVATLVAVAEEVATTDGKQNIGVVSLVASDYVVIKIGVTDTLFYTADAAVSDLTSFKDGKVAVIPGALNKGDTVRFTIKVSGTDKYVAAAFIIPGAFDASADTGNKLTATGATVAVNTNTVITITAANAVKLDSGYVYKYVWTDTTEASDVTVANNANANTYTVGTANLANVTCKVTVVSALDGSTCGMNASTGSTAMEITVDFAE